MASILQNRLRAVQSLRDDGVREASGRGTLELGAPS